MKIFVKAKPKSKKEYIKQIDATHYIVAVKELPVAGKANQAIIESLANYFQMPKTQISIVSGETSKQKIFVIPITEDGLSDLESQKKLF